MAARSRARALLSILMLLSTIVHSSSRHLLADPPSLFDQISADLAPYKAHGVSESMVDGVYCGIRDPGFRVQIINQEVYIVGEVKGFQSRNRNIKLALVDVASAYDDLPDCDFVVGTYDWTATEIQPSEEEDYEAGGPVFAQAKLAEHTNAILYPDHTFTDWAEADTASWTRQQYVMRRSAVHHPWHLREPSLLFRGSNLTGNRHLAYGFDPMPGVDIRVWDWVQEPAHESFIGLPQHCRNKYLLNWPGNSYSARLKYLLLCGSVVVHSDNGWYEFFYHMLKHGDHLLKVKALNSTEDLDPGLTHLIQRLNENPKRSRHIASNGLRFAQETLSPDSVREYWYRLLKAYAALQRHPIRLHPDAVPLGVSVSHPTYIHYRNRTGCHTLDASKEGELGLPQGPGQGATYHVTEAVSATAEPEAPIVEEADPTIVPDPAVQLVSPAVGLEPHDPVEEAQPQPASEPHETAGEPHSRTPETVGEQMAEPASSPRLDDLPTSVLSSDDIL